MRQVMIMTDTPWADWSDPDLVDFARELAEKLADSGRIDLASELYASLGGADVDAEPLGTANGGYGDAIDLSNVLDAQLGQAATVAAEDAAPPPRSAEARLARSLGRIARGTYQPAGALEFASPSSAARELGRRRWQVTQPGPVTGRANCGASDEFGHCIEPYHAAGCGSIASTEIAEALRDSGAYARLASQPFADANGRHWADQFGRPVTAAGHIEAAAGERLGGGAAFESGYGKRDLISPQRQARFADYDDPEDPGGGVPYETAALAGAVQAQARLAGRDAAWERERHAERRTEAAVSAALSGRGLARRPDDAFDVTSRREHIAAQRGAVSRASSASRRFAARSASSRRADQ
jgi:hypothetical protein